LNRNLSAFLIALFFHIILLLLLLLFALYTPVIQNEPKKDEKRIKIELKDLPKKAKQLGEKKKVKPPEIAPPLPQGSQLKKLVQKPFKKYEPNKKPIKKIENKPKKVPKPQKTIPKKQPKIKPIPSNKPMIPVAPLKKESSKETKKVTKIDENMSKENAKLYTFLSKKVESKESKKKQKRNSRTSKINQDIKELYGDEFGKLSEGEQKYILDNQEIMRRQTQQVLNRVGAVNIPHNLRVNRQNIVEFYLYPNGDISEIKLIENSGFYILDDTTTETIGYAYSRYPRPKQKTLIRYKVGYNLRGF
jgi:outer membrane biosynthesis protein TonB